MKPLVALLLSAVLYCAEAQAQFHSTPEPLSAAELERLLGTAQAFESHAPFALEERNAAALIGKLAVEPAATCTTYSLPYAGIAEGKQLWGVVDRFMPSANSCYLSNDEPWEFWSVPARAGEEITVAIETTVRTYFSIESGSVYYGSTVLQPNGKYLGGYIWKVPASFTKTSASITVSPYATSVRYTLAVAKPVTSGTCTATSTALCLNGGRFRVEVSYVSPSASGNGTGVSLTTDTGYFWFFSSANVEVMVKVVDGRGVNGKFWVFAAGLTNVDTLIRITDTQTGAVRTYRNPPNTAFQPIQDTSAF